MSANVLLSVNKLRYKVHKKEILTDLSFNLAPGSWTCVVGPNGAGKTTLLRLLAGIVESHSGHISIGGEDLSLLSAQQRAQKIAYVAFTTPPMLSLTTLEVLQTGIHHVLRWQGSPTHEDIMRCQQALTWVGMAAHGDAPFNTLSQGQRHRILIARALLQNAPVLILDEPTANLDMQGRVVLFEILNERVQKQGLTIIQATHDLILETTRCSDFILLKEGRLYRHCQREQVNNPELWSTLYDTPMQCIEKGRQTLIVPDL